MNQTFAQPQHASRDIVEDDAIDLATLLSTLWAGKWIIAAITAAAVFLGAYYAFVSATPYYTSTSVIILEPQQNSIIDIESVVGGLSGGTEEVNSEVEVLKSRSLMAKVVEELDLITDPEFNPSLREQGFVGRLRSNLFGSSSDLTDAEKAQRDLDRTVQSLLDAITVRNIPRSYVFEVDARTQSARKSARVADAVASLYVQDQIEVKFEATEQATTWLSGRVTELQEQLETAEQDLSRFSASIDLISVEALQVQEIQLKDVRDRVQEAKDNTAIALARLNTLKAANSRGESAALANDNRLNLLLNQLDTDTQAEAEFDARLQQIIDRAAAEVDRFQQQLTALEASEETLSELIEVQGADLITLQQLTREAEAVGRLYEYFLTRFQETSAQEGIQQADSRVLSTAVVPTRPTEPRKSLVLAISAILGLMIGGAYVLITETRKTGFRTAEDLETFTGISVLGQIPKVPAANRSAVLQYLADKPASAAAEAYRNLRTSIMLSNVDNPPQVILSTSCVPKEGKTTNSIALAQNLGGLGKRVLLIEGDIRRRTFGQYFKDLPEKGIVSVLSGEAELNDILHKDDLLNAWILPGEETNANAADLFASDRFQKLMSDLRKDFDVIIIDTPPVLVVPDARIIAEVTDAIIFTVEWDSTGSEQVAEALRVFGNSGQKISGMVLGQINGQKMKRYGYGAQGGVYSSYGAEYYKN